MLVTTALKRMIGVKSLYETFRILRKFHDCSSDFVSRWLPDSGPKEPNSVICHNDFAPYNLVYQQGLPVGIIDFDHASVGSRQWDLAYAVYRFVPLSAIVHRLAIPTIDPIARIDIALKGYGKTDTGGLYEMIVRRIESVRKYTFQASQRSDENAQRIIREQHIESYEEDLRLLKSMRHAVSDVFANFQF